MSVQCSPYLSFPGNAGEAFAYYHEVFGGELDLTRYEDMPMDLPFDPPAGSVAHAVLTAPGLVLSGGDAMGESLPPLASDVYSFLLTVDEAEAGRAMLERFVADGGRQDMPFAVAPWGDHYGQAADRFGVRWAVTVPGGDAAH